MYLNVLDRTLKEVKTVTADKLPKLGSFILIDKKVYSVVNYMHTYSSRLGERRYMETTMSLIVEEVKKGELK